MTRALVGAVARLSIDTVRRAWPALLVVSVMAALLGAATDLGAAAFARWAVRAQFATLHAWAPAHVYSILGLEIGLVRTVLDGVAFVLGFGAAAVLTAEMAASRHPSLARALGRAAARLPQLVAAYLGAGAVALLLGIACAPLLLLSPIGIAAAAAGAFLWFRRPARRPLARWLVTLGVPFGLLVDVLVRLALALPAAAIEGDGPRAAFGVSRRLVRGRWWTVTAVIALTVLAVFLLTALPTMAIAAAGAAVHPTDRGAPAWTAAVLIAFSVLLSELPAVALAALYLALRDGHARTRRVRPPRHRAPAPARRRLRPAVTQARRLAAAALLATLYAAAAVPAGAPLALAAGTASPARTASTARVATTAPAATATPAATVRPATLCGGPPPAPAVVVGRVAHPATSTNFVVTTTSDCVTGSLRDAITQANALAGPATITFALSGTFAVTQILNVTGAITIDGSGQSVVIDGGGTVPVLTSSTNPLTLQYLTIAHGYGAPASGWAGGATVNGNALTVTGVTFESNTGDVAGGLITRGPATITGSTFHANTATNGGGALSLTGTATVDNSTFVLNSGPAATGGAILDSGLLTASGITVVESTGGGISHLDTVNPLVLDDSYLEGNNQGDCEVYATVNPVSGSGNVDSDGSCGGGGRARPGNHDQNLGAHGGATQTITMLQGSPAIGAGTGCLATDQRGVARASACTAGAYEFQPQAAVALVTNQGTYNLGDTAALTATVSAVHEAQTPFGSVAFYDGTTSLGTAVLDGSGTALFSTSALAIGPHTLTATYLGETNGFSTATSAGVPVTVNGYLSTLTLASSLNPSTSGDSVTFTAGLTSGPPGSATGTITFHDGLIVLSTLPVVGDAASFTTSSLAIGHHSITVSYGGDANHGTGTSAVLDQDVRAPTTTTATTTSPAVYGTASVSVTVTGGSAPPSGIVNCLFGSASISLGLDATGHATCALPAWAPGSGLVTVSYYGDDGHAPSSGTVALTITAAATGQVLSATPAVAVYGQPVTLTDTVTAAGTPSIPTGSVTFATGASTVATVGLDAGGGASTSVLPPLGTTTYTSTYTPGTGFATTAGRSVTVSVSSAPTTTAVASSTATSVTGQPVTLTATVTAGGGSTLSPTGSVLFADGAGFSQSVALSASGAGSATAAVTTSTLAVGSHSFVATLVPGSGFGVSASPTVVVAVSAASTTTTVAVAPPSPVAYGQPVTLTATVAAVAPGGGTPAGNIEFFDGTTDLGGATLNGAGQAALTLTLPATGSHTYSASYAGSGSYLASSSAGTPYTIGAVATVMTVTGPSTSTYGSTVTITAHVSAVNGTPVVGSVAFYAYPSGVIFGSAAVDASGNATLTTSVVPGGTTSVSPVFNTTADFAGSTATLVISVARATPTFQFAAAPDPTTYFGNVTLTVHVLGIAPSDVPRGWVTVYVDYVAVGEDAVDATGTVSLTINTASPPGYVGPLLPYSHTLTAVYSYDYYGGAGGNYATTTSPNFLRFTVNPVSPGLTVAASPDPAGTSVPFTLTATVTPVNGQMPQGTVSFYETTGGLIGLGTATVAPDGTASITYTWPSGGTLHLRADFTSTSAIFGSQSVARTLTVGTLATSVTAGASPGPWFAENPLTLSAYVTSTAPVTAGYVYFYDGTGALCSGSVTSGTASCRTVLTAGTHTITASYTGWGASFAPSSGTTTLSVLGHVSIVTATATPATVDVGQSALVSYTISSGDSTTLPATGQTTISNGTQSCTGAGSGGSCFFMWSTAGPELVTVSFAGDSVYSASSTTLWVDVVRTPPALNAWVGTGARWVAGETITVYWQLLNDTPAPTGTVRVANVYGQGCTAQPLTGSCAVPVPRTGSQAITVTYSGDTQYATTSQAVTGTAVACRNFYAYGSPSPWGGVELLPTPDCAHGTGYADGDQVLVFPRPADHHRFTGFDGYPGAAYLDLTISADTVVVARFDWICDSVTVEYVDHAEWFPVTNPDCGPVTTDPATHSVQLPYHDGEPVTFTGEDITDPNLGLYQFAGWLSYPSGFTTSASYTFTVAPYTDLRPYVTRPCYALTPVFSDAGGGHVDFSAYGSACTLPNGSPGYHYGDSVSFHIVPTVTDRELGFGARTIADPSYLVTGQSLTGADPGSDLQPVPNSLPGYFHVTVHGDDTIHVSVARCRNVTTGTDPDAPVVVNHQLLYPPGRVAVSGTPCADIYGNALPDWFAGPVTVSATPLNGFQFYTWHGDTASGLNPALSPTGGPATITLDGAANHHLVAAFGQPNSCYPLPLEVGSASFDPQVAARGWSGAVVPTSPLGTISIDAETPERTSGHGYCPPNLYEAGSTIFVNLNPTAPGVVTGFMARSIRLNPDGTINSWVNRLTGPLANDGTLLDPRLIGQSQPQLGIILPGPGGGLVTGVSAWFCYPVAVTQSTTSPNGTPFDAPVGLVGLNAASTSQACPIAPTTFPAGVTLTAVESAQTGYTFTGWTGTVTGSSSSVSFTVRGPAAATAQFDAACYSLTVDEPKSTGDTGGDDTYRSDQPNCPGYPQSQGMYLAGTVVALQAPDHGSQEPFEGWVGADQVSGNVAVVTMNANHALHALYNDDLEHPTASASAFGTYMSAVGKATLGALATALSDYVLNFTSVGLVGLVGTIGNVLGDIGVPYATQIGHVMNDLSNTINGPLDCLGTWGLSNGSTYAPQSNATSGGSTASSVAGGADTAVTTVQGEGVTGWLAHRIQDVQDYAAENSGELDEAGKATYALKWVAMGVQLGTQLSNATLNSDWSLSTFDNQMEGCLTQRAQNLVSGN